MTKSELKKYLERTLDIIRTAKQYVYDSQCILLLDTAEKDEVIRPNKFMYRTYVALWTLAIIDTHKLFGGRNDDSRLQKLIYYLMDAYRNSDWREDITLEEIKILEAKLADPKVVAAAELLKELRSQHYAHKQRTPKRHETEVGLDFKGADFLLNVAEGLCDTINEKLFDNRVAKHKIDKESVNMTIEHLVKKDVRQPKLKALRSS